jgi:hypothetical protein
VGFALPASPFGYQESTGVELLVAVGISSTSGVSVLLVLFSSVTNGW